MDQDELGPPPGYSLLALQVTAEARRTKWRFRSEGAHPDRARKIRPTWAAVSAAATASTSAGVLALPRAVLDTSASNPRPATAGFEAATV